MTTPNPPRTIALFLLFFLLLLLRRLLPAILVL
jgi:hypothetical protein